MPILPEMVSVISRFSIVQDFCKKEDNKQKVYNG